jgi:predicted DNA-binding transcriptional regulator AlpA
MEAQEMAFNDREYLNTKQAEEYSGLGGFAKRRVTGNGPPFVKIGGRVVYERSAIEAWLRARTFSNTTEQSAAEAIADAAHNSE